MELRTLGQNFAQLGKRPSKEIRFAVISPCQRVMTFDSPIHIVRNMSKEPGAVTFFEASEQAPDLLGRLLLCRHILLFTV